MARLDRLAPAKEVAQVGALIGREFSRRLLAARAAADTARKLDAALDDLVRSELVARRGPAPDATYSFKHALIRDTASNSMLKSQRVLRHGQIAAAIERSSPRPSPTTPSCWRTTTRKAGSRRGLRLLVQAGDLAAARLSHREAMSHYRSALALLAQLGDRPQARPRSSSCR